MECSVIVPDYANDRREGLMGYPVETNNNKIQMHGAKQKTASWLREFRREICKAVILAVCLPKTSPQ